MGKVYRKNIKLKIINLDLDATYIMRLISIFSFSLLIITSLLEGAVTKDRVFIKVPPTPKEIVAFGNNPFRQIGPEALPLSATEETIADFLAKGRPFECPASIVRGKYGALSPLAFPPRTQRRLQKVIDSLTKQGIPPGMFLICGGVFVTADQKVYFWQLIDNRALFLRDAFGGYCALVTPSPVRLRDIEAPIPEWDSMTLSPILKPPKADDVLLIENQHLTWFDFGTPSPNRRLTVAPAFVMNFLRDGNYCKPKNLMMESPYEGLASFAPYVAIRKADEHAGFPGLPEGMMFTKEHEVFFWKVLNDRVLEIRTEKQDTGFYVLPGKSDSNKAIEK